jgi:hypothetical protein
MKTAAKCGSTGEELYISSDICTVGSSIRMEMEAKKKDQCIVKLTILVKDDSFVIDIRWVLDEPSVEPVEGGTLGKASGGAGKVRSSMIGKKDVTGFTVETCVSVLPFTFLRHLTSEGKVNDEALVRDGDFASQVMAGG